MLGPGRYLLGVVELLWLVGFASLGAAKVRRRLLPEVGGEAGFLASAVVAIALLVWVAEVLGTVSLFKPVPYLVAVGLVGAAISLAVGDGGGKDRGAENTSDDEALAADGHGSVAGAPLADDPVREGVAVDRGASTRPSLIATVISLVIAGIAIGHFVSGVRLRLGTGMTGFDSTWYHGPFAAGFFQSGNTIDLHFIAPQFLAWFYPANSEVVHAIGMLAFSRDLLSPLLNLGWLVGCLLACWCIGRPFRVAPWSLALGAIALSVPALADQAGEARNDIVGIFFLLAAVAIALNAAAAAGESAEGSGAGSGGRVRRSSGMAGGAANSPAAGPGADRGSWTGPPADLAPSTDVPPEPGPSTGAPRGAGLSTGAAGGRALSTGGLLAVGLAAGLAAGTKLNFLLPAAVLVLGLAALAPPGARWRALLRSGGMALAGGGYWYLRNLIHTGNPLPWIHHLGPIDLPAPEQALGGREAHSVLSYLTNGSVWSDWFLPGLHGGLWIIWPALGAAALAGLLLALVPFARGIRDRAPSAPGRWAENRPHGQVFGPSTRAVAGVLALAGLVGLAAAASWLVSPTSASGPDGMPRGFESGLRYLIPALLLGLTLLPTVPPFRALAARIAAFGPALGERPIPPSDRAPLDDRPVPPADAAASADRLHLGADSAPKRRRSVTDEGLPGRWVAGIVVAGLLLAALIGYPVERHYLQNRYRDPSFTTPGLDAAFAWARDVSGARIATTSTRQYPLFGTDLSNRVAYVGIDRPHGGFEEAQNCRQFRRLINAGDYDYVVATRDRIEPGKPAYPPQAAWTAGPNAHVVLKKKPTVVFAISGPLDPKSCP